MLYKRENSPINYLRGFIWGASRDGVNGLFQCSKLLILWNKWVCSCWVWEKHSSCLVRIIKSFFITRRKLGPAVLNLNALVSAGTSPGLFVDHWAWWYSFFCCVKTWRAFCLEVSAILAVVKFKMWIVTSQKKGEQNKTLNLVSGEVCLLTKACKSLNICQLELLYNEGDKRVKLESADAYTVSKASFLKEQSDICKWKEYVITGLG